MREAPSWPVRATPEFEAEYEELEVLGGRLGPIRTGWEWYLARRPFEAAHGLTSDDDELRILTFKDVHEGAEYVAGAHVDRKDHVVYLTWISRLEL